MRDAFRRPTTKILDGSRRSGPRYFAEKGISGKASDTAVGSDALSVFTIKTLDANDAVLGFELLAGQLNLRTIFTGKFG
jgi:hypothetical protein